ncbi:MAG: DNA/RNA non-specific endonuclease [Rikenellaceae bacterium]
MKRSLLTIIFSLYLATLLAQYQPQATGELVEHTHYSLDYIEQHEQPQWVYYRLTSDQLKGDAERASSFKIDPKVSTRSASSADYTNSGYDRGHLCPAADMSHSELAMRESFYMSNISPQAPKFNRGIWKSLEERVRKWCATEGELHITTSGILSESSGTIGKSSQISIPKRYYKAIYAPKSNKMIAFILPNESSNQPLQTFAVTVDEVEAATGIDLFPQLDDKIETKLEATINLSLWEF